MPPLPPDPSPGGEASDPALALTNDHPVLRHFWFPVARADEVGSLPTRVEVAGHDVVLARTDGGLLALPDACSHRGAPLSLGTVDAGCVVCPYHGWRFAADGRCESIPALGDGPVPPRAHLTSHRVTERYGLVWVCLDEPWAPLPEIPEWDQPGRTCTVLKREVWRASTGLMLENLLDMAHLPLLHASTLGDPGDVSGEVLGRSEHGFAFAYDQLAADETGDVKPRKVRYDVQAPFVLRTSFSYPGVERVAFGLLLPVSHGRTQIFGLTVRSGGADWDAFQAFEDKVVEEDRWLMEALADRPLHLDRTVEVHTVADRAALELRRMWRGYVDRYLGTEAPLPTTPAPTTDTEVPDGPH